MEAMGTGFLLDKRNVPPTAQPSLRRALARVVKLVEDKHQLGFRLFEHFNGMILAPAAEETDFGAVIKKRAALLLAGDWKVLMEGIVRRTPGHVSSPLLQQDPLDTKASKAQYHITRNGSVSKATQALRSPVNPPTPVAGAMTAIMSKLHPQVGDPIPDSPFPHLRVVQGGGDRLPSPQPPLRLQLEATAARALNTRRVREAIAQQHVIDDLPTGPPISFTTHEVIQRVRRGDNGTAGGLDGTDYRVMKIWFSKNDLLSESLTRVLNMIAAGEVSDEGRVFLNASRGVGVPKDDLGDIRPVAVGHMLLRLVGSLALKRLTPDIQKYFQPAQFGVGTQNGCELMINAITARLKLNPGDICINSDVKNAFNSFSRAKLWEPLRRHFPSLEHLVRLAYMDPGTVVFDESGTAGPSEVFSSVGSRQGCSLGSFLYALAIHQDLLALRDEFKDCHITAYCDDLTIVGPPDRAILAYKKWSCIYGEEMQGELRDEKGFVFSRTLSAKELADKGLPEKVQFSSEGIKTLGAPIGTPGYVFAFIEERVQRVEQDMQLVARMTLHHAQHALTTKGIQHRIGFLFRCVPCGDRETFGPLAARYDRALLAVPQRICHHVSLSQRAIDIVHLPMYLGGLGYRRWMDVADSAFLASYTYTRKVLPTLFPDLQAAFPDPRCADLENNTSSCHQDRAWAASAAYLRMQGLGPKVFDSLGVEGKTLHHLQKDLSEIVDQRRANGLVTSMRKSSDPRARQHLAYHLSARADSYSFGVLPYDADTTLSNRTLQIAMSLRLLEPIIPFNEDEPSTLSLQCPCCHKVGISSMEEVTRSYIASTQDVDHWGYHSYRCFKDGGGARRRLHHDKLVLIWERALRHAGFTILHEPSGHLLLSEKRPDSIIVDGNEKFLDVRTCDPLLRDTSSPSASTMFERCVDVPGTAAIHGARLKDTAWKDLVEAQGDSFLPLCHEMPGFIGEAALVLLNQAAARFSPAQPQRNAFTAFWLMRLHIANIRGVADTIQESLPFHPELPFGPRAEREFFIAHPSPSPGFFDQASLSRRPRDPPLQIPQLPLPPVQLADTDSDTDDGDGPEKEAQIGQNEKIKNLGIRSQAQCLHPPRGRA
jgi:hypothetical protein